MSSETQYRTLTALGTVLLGAVGVLAANHPSVQQFVTTAVPVVRRLEPTVLRGDKLVPVVLTTVVVVFLALLPLYKPVPRRTDRVVVDTVKSVGLSVLALATIGYFDYTFRLPRATLIVFTVLSTPVLVGWLLLVRRVTLEDGDGGTIVAGDSPALIEEYLDAVEGPVVGFVSPPSVADRVVGDATSPAGPAHVGGLSRIDDVVTEYNVDTVILAFDRADREEFFGVVEACHEYGLTAKVNRTDQRTVFTSFGESDELFLPVEIEPWDWQDYVTKRLFDVLFSTVTLFVLSPLLVAIAVAVRLDSPGSVFYTQERTAARGKTITVTKYRTMTPHGESAVPTTDEERVTRVGRLLRRTHLDEVPQFVTVLRGDMSVVGPRPAWTKEENLIQADAEEWQKRWFVKPGLTGLAQINDAASSSPREKLRYDIEYIRRRSLLLDTRIVARQLLIVADDFVRSVFGVWETEDADVSEQPVNTEQSNPSDDRSS
jgi:lipopolysaccharide/colanic/teichoic acid biosynthesis glycosyltransferase